MLLFWLKTSRPGLWFQTLWLYTLPTAQMPVWKSWVFWVGLIYVTFPLNFLVYGWNDRVDYANDLGNPRKDSFLFGARGSLPELASLPLAMTLVQLPFVFFLIWEKGPAMFTCLGGIFLTLGLYNLPHAGWRGRPPLELINQLGYLLILPFSMLLNHTSFVSLFAWIYLVLFCTHSHLIGEIMDVLPDAKAGRWTSVRYLGVHQAKWVVIILVLIEALILGLHFHDLILGGCLLLGLFWLLLDLLVFYGERAYTQQEFQLFGIAINVAGFASMAWVWQTGTLLRA